MTSSLDQSPTFPSSAVAGGGGGGGESGSADRGGSETVFHQQELSLIVTMYQELVDKHTGTIRYQDKVGSVVVRRKLPHDEELGNSTKKRGRKTTVQYSGLGVAQLDLARIATLAANHPTEREAVVLQQCLVEGATVQLSVLARCVEDADQDQDTVLFGEWA